MNKTIVISILLSSMLIAEDSTAKILLETTIDSVNKKVQNLYGEVEEDIEYKGNMAIETAYFNHDIDNKRDNQSAMRFEIEGKYQFKENQKFVAKLKAIYDTNDNKRRYWSFTDLYFQHDFDKWNFLIGKNTRFWGAMEFYNQSDTFNTKDWLDNPFDYDSKIGSWNIAFNRFFDNSEFSLIVKLNEEKQPMQESRSIYNFVPYRYNETLDIDSGDVPTIYLKYSSSIDEYQIDYSVIYQNGYDEQRYLIPKLTKDINISMQQHAYTVDKFMGFGTMVKGDTLYKTELAYTSSHDNKVSDYAQGSIGLEHTLYGVYEKMDLGIIAEYYKYKTFQTKRYNAKSFGQLFDDDLTVGLRLALNDIESSEILAGLVVDRHNKEKILSVDYDTRIDDKYKLKVSFQHFDAKQDSSFSDGSTIRAELRYYF